MLWSLLRNRQLGGFKFRRQFPVDRYIADFACIEAHVIVELDGGQHAAALDKDTERTRVLEAAGFTVLRFWNDDIPRRLDAVQETILAALRAAP